MRARLRRVVTLVRRHPAIINAARLGYGASGALHLVIAWTALELAWVGSRTGPGGALQQLAVTVTGRALLWLIATGLGALTLWQLTGAVTTRDRGARAKRVGRAAVYAALCWAAAGVADGEPGDDPTVDQVTAALMRRPAGVALVLVLGVCLVAMGFYHAVKGWRAAFVGDLRGTPSRWVVWAGRVGYIAKGIALIVTGSLLVVGAAAHRSNQPQGLDAALHVLLRLPLGAGLLAVIAAGFAGYAAYAFARARHTWC